MELPSLTVPETVKVKFKLPWRSQNIGGTRNMDAQQGKLQSSAVASAGKRPCVPQSCRSRAIQGCCSPGDAMKSSWSGQRAARFGVRPAGIQSCLVQFFLPVFPMIPLERGLFTLSHGMLEFIIFLLF